MFGRVFQTKRLQTTRVNQHFVTSECLSVTSKLILTLVMKIIVKLNVSGMWTLHQVRLLRSGIAYLLLTVFESLQFHLINEWSVNFMIHPKNFCVVQNC